MPPKRRRERPFPWCTGKGALTPFLEGVLYGQYLAGISLPVIADRLSIAKSTAYDVLGSIQRRLDENFEPHEDERCGTPATVAKKVAQRQAKVAELVQERGEDGRYVVESSTEIRRKLDGIVSTRTINRDLNALGLTWVARPKVPALTEDQMTRRLDAEDALRAVNARNILFSDESLFDCNDRNVHAWARPGEQPEPRPTDRWTAKCHVWGVIGVGFRLLVFLPSDRVTAELYQQTVRRWLLPRLEERHVFMQDNAPAHRARQTLEFFAQNNVNTLPWPAKSPDLNPIENVWGLMKRRLKINVHADESELEEAITDAWFDISQDVIDQLCLSFESRIDQMVAAEGGPVVKKRARV